MPAMSGALPRNPIPNFLSPRDERARGQIENQAAVHLGLKLKSKLIERFLGIAKLGLFTAAFPQPLAAPGEFIVEPSTR
jgi:hypothetical protein